MNLLIDWVIFQFGALDTVYWLVAEDRSAVLGFVGVAQCSVTIIRVWLKVLGKTFVMVLLCHSHECG